MLLMWDIVRFPLVQTAVFMYGICGDIASIAIGSWSQCRCPVGCRCAVVVLPRWLSCRCAVVVLPRWLSLCSGGSVLFNVNKRAFILYSCEQ
jgi:hypothetical protein